MLERDLVELSEDVITTEPDVHARVGVIKAVTKGRLSILSQVLVVVYEYLGTFDLPFTSCEEERREEMIIL